MGVMQPQRRKQRKRQQQHQHFSAPETARGAQWRPCLISSHCSGCWRRLSDGGPVGRMASRRRGQVWRVALGAHCVFRLRPK